MRCQPESGSRCEGSAIGVLIGLVAAGDAVSFSFGGGDTFVPTLVITQARSNALKSQLAAPPNVSVGGAAAVPLVGSMVGSSARGPSVSNNAIKPTSVRQVRRFPPWLAPATASRHLVAPLELRPCCSSAALILQGFPTRTPAEVKALLVNTAETNITTNPAVAPACWLRSPASVAERSG